MRIQQMNLTNNNATIELPTSLQRTTLLYFMRSATCAICVQHLRQIDKMQPTFNAKGMDVFIVVPEDNSEADKLARKFNVSLQVYSGNQTAHMSMNLEKKMFGMVQQSGTFIVSKDGEILYEQTATMPTQNFNERAILEFVGNL
jgi:peroxiredoxin